MLGALVKSFQQLSDPTTRGVMWRSIGLAALVFLALYSGAWLLIDWAGETVARSVGETGGVIDTVFDILAAIAWLSAMIVASWLLFPPVMTAVMSIFLEEVADKVEARHYPRLPAAREQPIWEAMKDALSLAGAAVLLNLVLLPVYLFPPFNIFVFYILNGYLLGREYFELVAVRRLPRGAVRQMRQRHRTRLILAGIVIVFLLTIPLVNLVTPIVATAFMVHIFESLPQPPERAEIEGDDARLRQPHSSAPENRR